MIGIHKFANLLTIIFLAALSHNSLADGCDSISSIPGVTSPGMPPIVFKKTDFDAKSYGTKLRMLYGDWDWKGDFGYSKLPRSPLANQTIAAFVSRCLTSYPVGRIHPGFLKQTEQDYTQYLTRIYDEVVSIKRELLLIQQNHDELLDKHMPEGTDESYKRVYRENMKKYVTDSLLVLTEFVDNHYLYTVEGMSYYFSMEKQLTTATSQIYELIGIIGDVPDADLWAFRMLKENTYSVLDTYALFFGDQQKQALRDKLNAASSLEQEEDLAKVKESLSAWAIVLEESMKNAFKKNTPYFEIALKIKFLFGTRDPGDEDSSIRAIQSRLGSGNSDKLDELLRLAPNDAVLWEGIKREI